MILSNATDMLTTPAPLYGAFMAASTPIPMFPVCTSFTGSVLVIPELKSNCSDSHWAWAAALKLPCEVANVGGGTLRSSLDSTWASARRRACSP